MSTPSRVRITGPLVPYASGFRADLEARGYRPNAVGSQLYVFAHMSRWLQAKRLGPDDLTPDRVQEFLRSRRRAGYTMWLSDKGVAQVLGYLRQVGAAPSPVVAEPAATAAGVVLEEFRSYLVHERGLAPGTVVADLHMARLFLASRPPENPGLDRLTPGEVVSFVRDQCEERSAPYVTAGLRAFLRFCHLNALTSRPLVGAVPRVASWRLAGLPKAVDPAIVRRLLAGCDRRTTYGRRAYAVIMLLAGLGLRSGEVAGLRLEDIDWRTGELLVRGKGPKLERLPLPEQVGAAIAAWLRRGRPRCSAREVITRIRAPHGPLSSGGIYAIVTAACEKAGVARLHPHQLRHTTATEMLRAGASLPEVGQVLRHQSLLTTAIYAKVDRDRLRLLASPWPGRGEDR